jgi:hypothetical protein
MNKTNKDEAIESRPTVGKIASELMLKEPETRDPIALEREGHKDYESNVLICMDDGKKAYQSDFYIVVITKKEKLMSNVLRNYFCHRSTCPTPDYDQAVYHYVRSLDGLDFLWVIPDKDTCVLLKSNQYNVAPEEWGLLRYVLQFADGTLFKLAKRLNKEELQVKESI